MLQEGTQEQLLFAEGACRVVAVEHLPEAHARLRHTLQMDCEHLGRVLADGELDAKPSAGKSGSTFMRLAHGENPIIVKIVKSIEMRVWSENLQRTMEHLSGGHSLLMQVLAMLTLRVQSQSGLHEVHAVLLTNGMRSVNSRAIDANYDLKGHTVNRSVPLLERSALTPLKDEEFEGMIIRLNEQARCELLAAFDRDLQFLKTAKTSSTEDCGVMDYSLLVGIQRVDASDGEVVASSVSWVPGGVVVVNRVCTNRYYLSLIDTGTEFDAKKKMQCAAGKMFGLMGKMGFISGTVSESAQMPSDYAERFLEMCVKIIV